MPPVPSLLGAPGPKVIVTAHPDDETMWSGALPLVIPGDWTVVCCSIPRRDPERAWNFYDACETLGVRARVLPFTEMDPRTPMPESVLSLVDLSRFVCVVTHNEHGEYGHLHHRQLNSYVRQRAANRMVCFGFGSKRTDKYVLPMSGAVWSTKYAALKCYATGSPPKWQALLDRYRPMGYDLGVETYYVDC